MKKVAILCFALAVTVCHGQVSITASSIVDASLTPLSAGRLCFQPVNAAAVPAGFRVGSVQVVPNEVCWPFNAGALPAGRHLAPSAAGTYYHVYVKSPAANSVLRDYGMTSITGSNWTLDTYDPNLAVVPAAGVAVGVTTTGAPGTPAACTLTGTGPALLNCSIPAGLPGTGSISGLTSDGASGIHVAGKVDTADASIGGIPTGPAPSGSVFIYEGDSLSAGYLLSKSADNTTACRTSAADATCLDWPSQAMLGKWFAGRGTKNILAVTGNKVSDLVARYVASVKPACLAGNANLFVMVGTNNLYTAETAADTFTEIAAYWSTAKADGCKIFALTVPPAVPFVATNTNNEWRRQNLNRLILASTIPDYKFDVDTVIDPSDNSQILPSGTDASRLHFTAAGYAAIAYGINAALMGKAPVANRKLMNFSVSNDLNAGNLLGVDENNADVSGYHVLKCGATADQYCGFSILNHSGAVVAMYYVTPAGALLMQGTNPIIQNAADAAQHLIVKAGATAQQYTGVTLEDYQGNYLGMLECSGAGLANKCTLAGPGNNVSLAIDSSGWLYLGKNLLSTVSATGLGKFPGGVDVSTGAGGLKIKDQGTCTMASGTCSAQSLGHTYGTAPACFASWTGTGTRTGLLKVPSTTTTVTPASSVGTDTAQVNWFCLGL